MSSDSPIPISGKSLKFSVDPWKAAGAYFGGVVGAGGSILGGLGGDQAHQAWNTLTQAPPKPLAPPAPPSLGEAAAFGLKQDLSHEQKLAASNTILTGGAGLLDEPTTASRVLLGS